MIKRVNSCLTIWVAVALLFGGCTESKDTKPSAELPQKKTTLEKAVNLGAGKCLYSTTEKDIGLEWTAFKFTEKAPVKGSFNSMKLKGPTQAESLADLVQGLSLDIDGASIESGNPGRNVTVKQFFFEKFVPAFVIKAAVEKVEGDETQGKLHIQLTLNSTTKILPFEYTVKDGALEANATMQMMDFGLKAAFDSIHTTCKTLHTGKDGVAKTWDVVDLKVTGKFKKVCG